MDDKKHITLHPEWTKTQTIKLNDICVSSESKAEFLCSKIIKHKQFEYLYFGSFDFKNILFAVQYRHEEDNYVKILTEKPEQMYAFNVYKEQK